MNLLIDNIRHKLGNTSFCYNADINDSITGIFGLSGSGKTTLMNIICGIEKPFSGKLVFNGRELYNRDKKINIPENKRNIGVVFQDNNLFLHLTIKQNLLYSKPYLKNRKSVIDYESVIDLLEIGHLLDKKPVQLSGGEKQRVAIGRTLLSQPELLLMDEPFSNLDKNRRKQIISYLLKINNQFGIPLLIISHDLEDILKLSRSLLIIKDGRVAATGDYLDIADSGKAADIISHKRYINVVELYHQKYIEEESINHFSQEKDTESAVIVTNSNLFSESDKQGKKVRVSISPDDIALSKEKVEATSIQNQLKGVVSKIRCVDNSYYITIDCGIELIAEITKAALEKMGIKIGATIYCLIKAKAIDIVHIFK